MLQCVAAKANRNWLDHARDSDYITPTQFAKLDASWQQIGGMLHKMTERSSDFCRVPKR